MRIAFDLKPQKGPFGGGNSFLSLIVEGLEHAGFEVHFDLAMPNLDFIFLLDPRWRHPMRAFNAGAVSRYLRKNPRTLIIHRINECDERKDTSFMNKKLRYLNCISDNTVFVGTWLMDLDVTCKYKNSNDFSRSKTVIKNGSDKRLYYYDDSHTWNPATKMKVVTHHWSSNPLKGCEIYQKLDDLLANQEYSEKFEFTYIGNVPKEATFRNTTVLQPLFGADLGRELRKHHVYLTGSKNEPGGNHQNEGGLSGLPIIFLRSGCMPEYCTGYGIGMQSSDDLEGALAQVRKEYSSLRAKMKGYPHTSTKMISEYVDYLTKLDKDRSALVRNRGFRQNSIKRFRLQFPI